MRREWSCTFCGKWVVVESTAHGYDLLRAMQQQHRADSPECERDGPLDISTPPLQPNLRVSFFHHLKQQVAGAEADAASETLDRVQLAVVKNDLVWLDCQLGTDGEAVLIYKEIEALNDRVLKLSPSD